MQGTSQYRIIEGAQNQQERQQRFIRTKGDNAHFIKQNFFQQQKTQSSKKFGHSYLDSFSNKSNVQNSSQEFSSQPAGRSKAPPTERVSGSVASHSAKKLASSSAAVNSIQELVNAINASGRESVVNKMPLNVDNTQKKRVLHSKSLQKGRPSSRQSAEQLVRQRIISQAQPSSTSQINNILAVQRQEQKIAAIQQQDVEFQQFLNLKASILRQIEETVKKNQEGFTHNAAATIEPSQFMAQADDFEQPHIAKILSNKSEGLPKVKIDCTYQSKAKYKSNLNRVLNNIRQASGVQDSKSSGTLCSKPNFFSSNNQRQTAVQLKVQAPGVQTQAQAPQHNVQRRIFQVTKRLPPNEEGQAEISVPVNSPNNQQQLHLVKTQHSKMVPQQPRSHSSESASRSRNHMPGAALYSSNYINRPYMAENYKNTLAAQNAQMVKQTTQNDTLSKEDSKASTNATRIINRHSPHLSSSNKVLSASSQHSNAYTMGASGHSVGISSSCTDNRAAAVATHAPTQQYCERNSSSDCHSSKTRARTEGDQQDGGDNFCMSPSKQLELFRIAEDDSSSCCQNNKDSNRQQYYQQQASVFARKSKLLVQHEEEEEEEEDQLQSQGFISPDSLSTPQQFTSAGKVIGSAFLYTSKRNTASKAQQHTKKQRSIKTLNPYDSSGKTGVLAPPRSLLRASNGLASRSNSSSFHTTSNNAARSTQPHLNREFNSNSNLICEWNDFFQSPSSGGANMALQGGSCKNQYQKFVHISVKPTIPQTEESNLSSARQVVQQYNNAIKIVEESELQLFQTENMALSPKNYRSPGSKFNNDNRIQQLSQIEPEENQNYRFVAATNTQVPDEIDKTFDACSSFIQAKTQNTSLQDVSKIFKDQLSFIRPQSRSSFLSLSQDLELIDSATHHTTTGKNVTDRYNVQKYVTALDQMPKKSLPTQLQKNNFLLQPSAQSKVREKHNININIQINNNNQNENENETENNLLDLLELQQEELRHVLSPQGLAAANLNHLHNKKPPRPTLVSQTSVKSPTILEHGSRPIAFPVDFFQALSRVRPPQLCQRDSNSNDDDVDLY